MHPTVRCMEKICPWNDLIGVYQPQCVQRERPTTQNACSQFMNSLYSNHQIEIQWINPGHRIPSKSRWKTLTSGFAPQQQMLGGVLPGPAHQASDSKFHQWCHERRLSPEVGQWLIYMIAGTWLESNTSHDEGPRRRLYIRLG